MEDKEFKAKEGHIYLVIDGELTEIEAPASGFGACTIKWMHGKIIEAEPTHKIRYERKK
ncbi:DUF3954 domain-containing protein [Niallia sp. 03190]|uniref:DUF3954 domain-containing protein n=1 Tax=Niallia sp. 03190 TaxID=3458061 RepID=UPI0040443925